MLQTRTAKLRIFPDEDQAVLLRQTMSAYTDACNYVSGLVSSGKVRPDRYRLHDLAYSDCRSMFSLPSQMAQSVIRTVTASYKSLRTNMSSHPEKFKKKKGTVVPKFSVPQLDLVRGRDYSLLWNKEHTERVFSLNTLKGRIKVPFRSDAMDWAFADGARMGTAKLVFRKGKFYLHIPVTVEVPDPPEPSDITDVVGIDRGIRFLTVSYDGEKTSFVSGAEVKQKRAHYKKLRQELQKKQTSSARRRLRAIGRRENRWMSDVNHCLSKTLVREHPEGTLFVLEDLTGIRSAAERVRVKDRYVQVSWPYYDLEQKLTYKAQMNGSMVIKVDPRYTSQRCPVCGHTERGNRDKRDHVFRCRECGYTTNDDRIGAMNLQKMGTEYLLKAQKVS